MPRGASTGTTERAAAPAVATVTPNGQSEGEWNGEYYVSFGVVEHRNWEGAVKYGFIRGGGVTWYSNTLSVLEAGARVWVNVPGQGYVGVGVVSEGVVKADQFMVKDEAGQAVPILAVLPKETARLWNNDDEEKAEYVVRVKWLKTVQLSEAIKEKGFFGNQNTVAQPKAQKWQRTIKRLKKRFGVE
ncbi:MAG: hypothetical protein NTU53_02455 [Planctomycetota bacterium]|nr:hypothetical protein [Planctomycetota bacterium]